MLIYNYIEKANKIIIYLLIENFLEQNYLKFDGLNEERC